MSYHQTRFRRRWPRGGVGDIATLPSNLPPLPDVPPAPEPEDSGKTWFEELTEPIAKVFGPPKPTPVIKPPITVPIPARPGMSTTTKILIAGGAVALVALITR